MSGNKLEPVKLRCNHHFTAAMAASQSFLYSPAVIADLVLNG